MPPTLLDEDNNPILGYDVSSILKTFLLFLLFFTVQPDSELLLNFPVYDHQAMKDILFDPNRTKELIKPLKVTSSSGIDDLKLESPKKI